MPWKCYQKIFPLLLTFCELSNSKLIFLCLPAAFYSENCCCQHYHNYNISFQSAGRIFPAGRSHQFCTCCWNWNWKFVHHRIIYLLYVADTVCLSPKYYPRMFEHFPLFRLEGVRWVIIDCAVRFFGWTSACVGTWKGSPNHNGCLHQGGCP